MNTSEKEPAFESLGLNPRVLASVEKAGFTKPSPIQEQVIPVILSESDVVAQAKTGSGKTAAFLLPALDLIEGEEETGLLVITPTRELADQVCGEVRRFGSSLGIKATAIYGGSSYSDQKRALDRGVQAIVATPGRLLDLLKRNRIPNFSPAVVVIDEADEMLDMGFIGDIEEIFSYLPVKRQALMFSATMPKPIKKLAGKLLSSPKWIEAAGGEETHQDITELFYLSKEHERLPILIRLIESHDPEKALVFCRTKRDCDELALSLRDLGYPVGCLHGDMEQKQRKITIDAFRSGHHKILVATDIAGRGIDISDISHVFNYQLPSSPESYVHRRGRTGRAGKKGCAISLLSPNEYRNLFGRIKIRREDVEVQDIPTLSDIKKQRKGAFLKSIQEHTAAEGATELFESLKEKMGLDEMCLNLLSLLSEKEKKLSSSETIGMNLNDLRKENSFGPKKGKKKPFFKGKSSAGAKKGFAFPKRGAGKFSKGGPKRRTPKKAAY